jgi:hypothetical protein
VNARNVYSRSNTNFSIPRIPFIPVMARLVNGNLVFHMSEIPMLSHKRRRRLRCRSRTNLCHANTNCSAEPDGAACGSREGCGLRGEAPAPAAVRDSGSDDLENLFTLLAAHA